MSALRVDTVYALKIFPENSARNDEENYSSTNLENIKTEENRAAKRNSKIYETLFNGQEIYKKDIFHEEPEHIAAGTL